MVPQAFEIADKVVKKALSGIDPESQELLKKILDNIFTNLDDK